MKLPSSMAQRTASAAGRTLCELMHMGRERETETETERDTRDRQTERESDSRDKPHGCDAMIK